MFSSWFEIVSCRQHFMADKKTCPGERDDCGIQSQWSTKPYEILCDLPQFLHNYTLGCFKNCLE